MKRHELMQRIAALPADADVGVRIGADILDIMDVVPWGDGSFAALECHQGDLRDLLMEWKLPRDLRRRLVSEPAAATTPVEEAATDGPSPRGDQG